MLTPASQDGRKGASRAFSNAPSAESVSVMALRNAKFAAAATEEFVQYLRALSRSGWSGPSGCGDWSINQLVLHRLRSSEYFAETARKAVGDTAVTDGDHAPVSPRSDETSSQNDNTLERLLRSAAALVSSIGAADEGRLRSRVIVAFGSFPTWVLTTLELTEAVLHEWDVRSVQDSRSVVRREWADACVRSMLDWIPAMARGDVGRSATGRYVFSLTDGISPVTLDLVGGTGAARWGAESDADLTLALTSDQYLRFLYGRLDLPLAVHTGAITIEGEKERVEPLGAVFIGVDSSDPLVL